jgi:hypothetical protein
MGSRAGIAGREKNLGGLRCQLARKHLPYTATECGYRYPRQGGRGYGGAGEGAPLNCCSESYWKQYP